MTIAKKILAQHCGNSNIEEGEFITCDIDLVMVHEQLGGRIAPEFENLGEDHIKHPDRIFFILDHWVPPPDVRAAKMHQKANTFAQKYKIKYNMGQNQGICHQVLPEKGFSRPGMLITGSDSHTTTYGAFNCFGTGIGATDVVTIFQTGQLWFKVPQSIRVNFSGKLKPYTTGKDVVLSILKDFGVDGANYDCFEFGGPALDQLSIAERMSIANMSVEMGAKAGIFEGDKILKKWLDNHPAPILSTIPKKDVFVKPEDKTDYKKVLDYDLTEIPPMVAKPYSPDNVVPVEELGRVEIDEGFIGSCTNGRLEDLRIAAKIMKGNKVANNVKFIIIPASREIYLQAMEEGLLKIFIESGGVVEYPSCGPCIGGHLGVLGPNEVAISTSNRNFKGRMGDKTSKSYLSSPAIVAASVIKGYITVPDQIIGRKNK